MIFFFLFFCLFTASSYPPFLTFNLELGSLPKGTDSLGGSSLFKNLLGSIVHLNLLGLLELRKALLEIHGSTEGRDSLRQDMTLLADTMEPASETQHLVLTKVLLRLQGISESNGMQQLDSVVLHFQILGFQT